MTPQEAIEKLSSISNYDPEDARCKADLILLAVLRSNGLSEVADAWATCRKRIGFWSPEPPSTTDAPLMAYIVVALTHEVWTDTPSFSATD